jgi:hypothetical protein
MNPISEQWHLPWHALQRDLALGLGADSLKPQVAAAKSVSVQSAASATLSWLGRARRNLNELPHYCQRTVMLKRQHPNISHVQEPPSHEQPRP